MTELRIRSHPVNDRVAMVHMAGTLDADNFNIMEDEFNRLLESGVRGVGMDLSEMRSISSAGLGALVNMTSVLRERNGAFIVTAPSESVDGLLDILGMREVLQMARTRDEAVRELGNIQ